VYEKLHEYVLSSIHLKNSIEGGYINSIDSRRRIIYNYSEVGEIEKMLDAFEQMILEEKENITVDDVSLAIYYNIINNKLEKAKELNEYLIKTYDNKELYY
jgi:pentatricopeptide repeat protein